VLRPDTRTLYLVAVGISVPGLILPAVGVSEALSLLAPAGMLIVLAAVLNRGAGSMHVAPNQPLEQRPAFRRALAIVVGAGWICMGLFEFVRAF
jgi:hypothetical protein